MSDYTSMDATLEILIMLLAAFILGWLFCWLMKKLFGSKPQPITQRNNLNEPTIPSTNRSGIVSSNREKLYSSDADIDLNVEPSSISKPEVNLNEVDLPKVTKPKTPTVEIDPIEVSKPRPRIDLPNLNTPNLNIKDKLDTGVEAGKSTLGKGLGAATAGIGALAVGASAFKDKAVEKVENLDLSLETPDIETPDVTITPPEVSLTDIDLPELEKPDFAAEIDLPDIPDIQAPDISAPDIDLSRDTSSIELPDIDLPDTTSVITDTLEAGKSKLSAGLGAAAAGVGTIAAGASALKNSTAEKAGDLGDKLTRPDLPSDSTNEAITTEEVRINSDQASKDDLTRISGIDEQVANILNSHGVRTYQDLQETNRSQLKGYLDTTGNAKLRELEPASWPHQATLCANKNWSKLSEYQSFLTGSNLDTRQPKPTYSVEGDDLKKVEGIGPFFESLLNEAGITTYEHLKNSSRDTLKEIIDAAGPDYRMHEPETWPYQAGLAYRGEWEKLKDYIHFMTGRN